MNLQLASGAVGGKGDGRDEMKVTVAVNEERALKETV